MARPKIFVKHFELSASYRTSYFQKIFFLFLQSFSSIFFYSSALWQSILWYIKINWCRLHISNSVLLLCIKSFPTYLCAIISFYVLHCILHFLCSHMVELRAICLKFNLAEKMRKWRNNTNNYDLKEWCSSNNINKIGLTFIHCSVTHYCEWPLKKFLKNQN